MVEVTEARPQPGIFRPSLPRDTQDVLMLFAIAARAACVAPEALGDINARLGHVQNRLVPPESHAAQECMKLWRIFSRVAQVPKEALRLEAGHAFFRDLDALGQRLDLPPLEDWQSIPEGVANPDGDAGVPETTEATSLATLEWVREQAKALKATLGPKELVPAEPAAEWIAALGPNDRRKAFDQMVGAGVLGRSEVNLLIRFLLKGDKLTRSDNLLADILQRMGTHLGQ